MQTKDVQSSTEAISLSLEQEEWLTQHGGRNAKHVEIVDRIPYVFMYSPTSLTRLELVRVGAAQGEPAMQPKPPKKIEIQKPNTLISPELNIFYAPQKQCKECNGKRFHDHKRKKNYYDHSPKCRYARKVGY